MKKSIYLLAVLMYFTNTGYAQWSIDSLSAPYNSLATTQNGAKAFFASSTKYEIFDFSSGAWSSHAMLQQRPNVKAITNGGKSYFGGGGLISVNTMVVYKNLDIYNAATNAWTTDNLSQPRMVGATAAVGNKVLFAGGRQILSYSNKVDIIDVVTGAKSVYNLSQARSGMAVAVVGSKVIFAGGECGNISNGIYTESNKVDIYDDATGTWSTALLSAKRARISVAVVGTKVLFAGGLGVNGYSNRIDIYDAATNTWTLKYMSEAKYGMGIATAGNKVYIVGGTINNSGVLSNRVEIYNAITNTRNFITISSPRMSMSVAQTTNRIMFAGGVVTWGNVATDRVEVLNLLTNTWTVEYLSQPRMNLAAASFGNKVLFAGGAEVLSSYSQYSIISKRVDIWTDPLMPLRSVGEQVIQNSDAVKIVSAYPNPCTDLITLQINNIDIPVYVSVYDMIGKLKFARQLFDFQNELELQELDAGIYFITIECEGKITDSIRIVKQ